MNDFMLIIIIELMIIIMVVPLLDDRLHRSTHVLKQVRVHLDRHLIHWQCHDDHKIDQ